MLAVVALLTLGHAVGFQHGVVPQNMAAQADKRLSASLGASAALSDGGYQAVAATKSAVEMKAFILRVLDASNMTVEEENLPLLDSFAQWLASTNELKSLPDLKEALSLQQWVVKKFKAVAAKIVQSVHTVAEKVNRIMGRSDAAAKADHRTKPKAHVAAKVDHRVNTTNPQKTMTKAKSEAPAKPLAKGAAKTMPVHPTTHKAASNAGAQGKVGKVATSPKHVPVAKVTAKEADKAPPHVRPEQGSAPPASAAAAAAVWPDETKAIVQDVDHMIKVMQPVHDAAAPVPTASAAAAAAPAAPDVVKALKDMKPQGRAVKKMTTSSSAPKPSQPAKAATEEPKAIVQDIDKMIKDMQPVRDDAPQVSAPAAAAAAVAPSAPAVAKALKDMQPRAEAAKTPSEEPKVSQNVQSKKGAAAAPAAKEPTPTSSHHDVAVQPVREEASKPEAPAVPADAQEEPSSSPQREVAAQPAEEHKIDSAATAAQTPKDAAAQDSVAAMAEGKSSGTGASKEKRKSHSHSHSRQTAVSKSTKTRVHKSFRPAAAKIGEKSKAQEHEHVAAHSSSHSGVPSRMSWLYVAQFCLMSCVLLLAW